MTQQLPVLLSGIKPTGDLHIGNYFGAMREQIQRANSGEYESFLMVADYHALNFIQDASTMREHVRTLACGYIAAGLDTSHATLFCQSSVPAHAELSWIFSAITTMPYLMRAHAFKDAEAKNKEISVGTFTYPLLMAADILAYQANIVPVGADQKQHVEYARDTAEKFNRLFGTTFTIPEPIIVEEVATVPGIDGQKMSKSYGNTIPLFASRDLITECVMSIVTDSSSDTPENVYAIHALVKSKVELEPLYAEHAGKYKALKEALIEDLDTFIAPMRTRYTQLLEDPEAIAYILKQGGAAARARTEPTINAAKRAIGVV